LLYYIRFTGKCRYGITEQANRLRDTLMSDFALLEVLNLNRDTLKTPPTGMPLNNSISLQIVAIYFNRTVVVSGRNASEDTPVQGWNIIVKGIPPDPAFFRGCGPDT